jgi:hypothetical protein
MPLLVLVVLCAAAAPSPSAPNPSGEARARALLDAARAATGGAAWDEIVAIHQVATIETSGLKGSAESWTDVRTGRYAQKIRLGPETGAEGWDGATFWTQDHSGQVRPQTGGDGIIAAKTNAYRNALAYWYRSRAKGALAHLGKRSADGRSYEVVRVHPEGGREFELWVDEKTHRIERMVEKKEMDTTVATFSDWRTVQGVTLPFVERDSIGISKYDVLATLTRVELAAPIPAAQFAPPAPPPPDFAFAPGRDRVTLPFELNNNHIYLGVKINGQPATVVFDTGATNYLYSESAARLGVHPEGALPGAGVGEKKEDTGLAKVDSIQLGDLSIGGQIFAVASSSGWPAIEGAQSAGLLGYEIVKRVPVIIDYSHRSITFVRPEAFRAPASVRPVAFRFADHLPEIDGSIDGIPARLHIDTGSRATIDLTSPFIEKNKLFEKYASKWEATTGWGVGGSARAKLARAHALVLGNQVLKEPIIELTVQAKGAFSSDYYDGNVGGEILRRYTLTLDYAHQQLWLEPNEANAEPFVFDRSGMFLAVEGGAFVVKDVTANAAAAKAGLKAGDRIVSMNGKTPKELPLPRLREWFRSAAAGTQVPVELAEGRTLTLTLADLL